MSILTLSLLAVIGLGLFLIPRFFYKRNLAEIEEKQLRKLDTVKTKLYTNITHEFRTPLTVILGMAEQIKTGTNSEKITHAADLIERNGKNLLDLVNQMLDLSKLESNRMALQPVQDDFARYIQYLLQSFEPIADSKHIEVHFYADPNKILMDFDPERISRIVTNLISNALKFTPRDGNIYVNLSSEKNQMTMRVRDTGIGIQPDKVPYIFDRFYQVEKGMAGQFHQVADSQARESVGTGIGLALVKELVKLMNGTIEVKSTVGKGTEFIIELPVSNRAALVKAAEVADASTVQNEMTDAARGEVAATASPADNRPLLLIVEDNEDVAQYIQICLEKDYQTLYAKNGEIGIAVALEAIPDLIISDVMMPVKDGLELTDTLKNDERTSHVPVILLTAKAGINSKLEGLRRGADAYLSKPFNQKELLGHAAQLIENRKRLQERYADPSFFKNGGKPGPGSRTADPSVQMEDEFIIKVNEIIEKSINDAGFGVLQLVHKLRMSRSQVFRKLKALTGKSIALYIRYYRLRKAKELLQTTDLNVSEIAYDVGFNNLSYFSRSFLEEFGTQPNATRN